MLSATAKSAKGRSVLAVMLVPNPSTKTCGELMRIVPPLPEPRVLVVIVAALSSVKLSLAVIEMLPALPEPSVAAFTLALS